MTKKSNNISNVDSLNNLCSVFQTRMAAYSNYSNQVWNRFNWLLTLQVGIAGFYINNSLTSPNSTKKAIFLALTVCILWLLMGIEDYFGLKRSYEKVKACNKIIVEKMDISKAEAKELEQVKDERKLAFRQTSLLYVFPATTLLAWLLVFYQIN